MVTLSPRPPVPILVLVPGSPCSVLALYSIASSIGRWVLRWQTALVKRQDPKTGEDCFRYRKRLNRVIRNFTAHDALIAHFFQKFEGCYIP